MCCDITVNKESVENMNIFVDADACPVVGIVEKIAEKYDVPVTLLCDTNHVLASEYSEVIVVGAGADAVPQTDGTVRETLCALSVTACAGTGWYLHDWF